MGRTLDQDTLKDVLMNVIQYGNANKNATANDVVKSIESELVKYFKKPSTPQQAD